MRPCPTNVNPNCISTASTNQSYGPAWRANQVSSDDAAAALETAILSLYEDAQLERDIPVQPPQQTPQQTPQQASRYLAFSVSSMFGRDVMEFVIRDEGVTNRNWEGDREGPLVTYRSMAGSVKYIWPIQQPITDFGAQKKRLDEIRERVGWKLIGCELIECYDTGPEPFFEFRR